MLPILPTHEALNLTLDERTELRGVVIKLRRKFANREAGKTELLDIQRRLDAAVGAGEVSLSDWYGPLNSTIGQARSILTGKIKQREKKRVRAAAELADAERELADTDEVITNLQLRLLVKLAEFSFKKSNAKSME